MSEIERAIELLEEISYNMGLERDTEYAGDAEKFNMLCGKKELIDIATEILRAELEREKNPLTVLDDLVKLWKVQPHTLASKLVKRHCTYDGCESFELPFNMGYEKTKSEAVKRVVEYLTSPLSSEPKGEKA